MVGRLLQMCTIMRLDCPFPSVAILHRSSGIAHEEELPRKVRIPFHFPLLGRRANEGFWALDLLFLCDVGLPFNVAPPSAPHPVSFLDESSLKTYCLASLFE